MDSVRGICFSMLLCVLLGVSLSGCMSDDFVVEDATSLGFSTDTVVFDTVFTTIGSSTRYFKLYNRSGNNVRIEKVMLAGGASSPYRINVDGRLGPEVDDVPIRAHDSLYVFVEVTIDPTRQDAPLRVADSVLVVTRTGVRDVKLIAWGQDVTLFSKKTFHSDTTLKAGKPFLIYDYLKVDRNVTLTIEPGVRLHFHNNAYLIVSGSLRVEGSHDNPVCFEGDRLESFYTDKPGQWGGVWLVAGSKENSIEWAELKNSIVGIVVDTCVTPGIPTLKLSHSKIQNCSYVALLARGATVVADNSLFANSAEVCVALTMGGEYRFYHCTIANYWGSYTYRKGPALVLQNFYTYQLSENAPVMLEPRDIREASFYNSIIYGNMQQELQIIDTYNGEAVPALMNFRFEDCILKVPEAFPLAESDGFIRTYRDNPKFKAPYDHCFLLDTLSPAKDKANVAISNLYPIDLNGESRLSDAQPDLGAYERIE